MREQAFMCNQVAGLSRCLTKVQDSMVAKLKTLHLDKSKSKAAERRQHTADKLDYLVTFNRSITQAMAHTMQDLSEGVFINMANLTIARHDRDNKNLPTGRGVVTSINFKDTYFHIPIRSVQEVHTFSRQGSVLQVQSTTLWSVHSTHGVHSGSQRHQSDGFTEGYKDPPVPRRLVGESQVPPYLSPAYTDLGSSLSGAWLAGEQGEIRTGSKTGFQLCRLPVRPERRQGQTHTRTLAGLNYQDSKHTLRSGVPGPAVHVSGLLTATEKQVHFGWLHMRSIQWHLKNNWRVPESLEKVIPVPRSLHPHLKW